MPSEGHGGRGLRVLIRSQGLGLLCGQATVLLLGIGSVLITRERDTIYRGLQLDDIRFFFEPMSWWHLWFYLLCGVMLVYALNTVLCTWHSVTTRWRAGIRQWSAYGPAVMHVSFLFAMLAHGVGGLWSEDRPPVMAGSEWSSLDEGRELRVADLRILQHPDGSARQVEAEIEVRAGEGAPERSVVRFNGPWSEGLGTDLLLIANHGFGPPALRIESGTDHCLLDRGRSCVLGGRPMRLDRVQGSEVSGAPPVFYLRAAGAEGLAEERFGLFIGQRHQLAGGQEVRAASLMPRPQVLLRRRHAPGNPLALLSALLILLGIGMMGRRWL